MNGGGGDKNEDRNKKYRQSKNKEFFSGNGRAALQPLQALAIGLHTHTVD